MEQVVVVSVTALGVPVVLAGVAMLIAVVLGQEFKLGPISVPKPPDDDRSRWVRLALLLIAIGLAVIAGGVVVLDRLANGSDDGGPEDATATAAASPTTVTATSTVTPEPTPTVEDLFGRWRTLEASQGEVLSLTISAGDVSDATIEGAYQGSFGVILLSERDATFVDGRLVQDSPWAVETSVTQIRVSSAGRAGTALDVELETCSVGQLGTTCTTATQTLVR